MKTRGAAERGPGSHEGRPGGGGYKRKAKSTGIADKHTRVRVFFSSLLESHGSNGTSQVQIVRKTHSEYSDEVVCDSSRVILDQLEGMLEQERNRCFLIVVELMIRQAEPLRRKVSANHAQILLI